METVRSVPSFLFLILLIICGGWTTLLALVCIFLLQSYVTEID